jgi:hypothetical protein
MRFPRTEEMTMAVRQQRKPGRRTARQKSVTGQQGESGLRFGARSLEAPPRRNGKDDYGAKLLSMKGSVADDVAL